MSRYLIRASFDYINRPTYRVTTNESGDSITESQSLEAIRQFCETSGKPYEDLTDRDRLNHRAALLNWGKRQRNATDKE